MEDSSVFEGGPLPLQQVRRAQNPQILSGQRQVTVRQIDPYTTERRIQEVLPNGRTRTTVEVRGPNGVQQTTVDSGSFGSQSVHTFGGGGVQQRSGLGGHPFAMLFSDPDDDPFELNLNNHQRFMRFNRGLNTDHLFAILMRMMGPQNRGMSRNQIAQIPTVAFRKDPRAKPGEEEKCSICITEFSEGEKVRALQCKHIFHAECIDTWLVQNSQCPVCKKDLAAS